MQNVIAGVMNTSLVDWPTKVVDTFFLSGCNYRCPTCHNKDIAFTTQNDKTIKGSSELEKSVNRFLSGWIDGIVLSGGEPTLYKKQSEWIVDNLYEYKIPVCVHTNATNLTFILKKINKVSLFCIDIKGPYKKYPELTGVTESVSDIQNRFETIFEEAKKNPHRFLFRTTLVPSLSIAEIEETKDLVPEGLNYITQTYIKENNHENS